MKSYFNYKLFLVLIFILFGCKRELPSLPPTISGPSVTPSTPMGPTSGRINITYNFFSSATHPDGDKVAIRFDWGNGVISDWSTYVPSGSSVSMNYSYPNPGTYHIKAQAKDIHGSISGWSHSHIIIIGEWITIMAEDFEGIFPGTTWTLYGSPTWDDETYRYYQGFRSGWCVGSTMSPPGPYAPYMNAWMDYGPFSLEDASDAYLEFYRWVDTEEGYDYLFVGASIDGIHFYGYRVSGDRQYWYNDMLDLTNVPTLRNLCGRSQVWIRFAFISDGSVQYEGVYLDNILLKKFVGTGTSGRPRVSSKEIDRSVTPAKMAISHGDGNK